MALATGNSLAFAQFPDDPEEHGDHLNRVLVIAQKNVVRLRQLVFRVILALDLNPPVDSLTKLIAALKAHCEGLGLGLSADENVTPEVLAVLKQTGLVKEPEPQES